MIVENKWQIGKIILLIAFFLPASCFVIFDGIFSRSQFLPLVVSAVTIILVAISFEMLHEPLERFFPISDVDGVELGARINYSRHMGLVLRDRLTRKEGIITCIHNIIAETSEPSAGFTQFKWRRTRVLARLAPREHLKALSSFVAFVTETGLKPLLLEPPITEFDFGFDAQMRSHFLQALRKVGGPCRVLLFETFADLLESAPEEWLQTHMEALAGEYGLKKLLADQNYRDFLFQYPSVLKWYRGLA